MEKHARQEVEALSLALSLGRHRATGGRGCMYWTNIIVKDKTAEHGSLYNGSIEERNDKTIDVIVTPLFKTICLNVNTIVFVGAMPMFTMNTFV